MHIYHICIYTYLYKICAIHIYITSLKTNMFASAKMMVGSWKCEDDMFLLTWPEYQVTW